MMPSRFRSSGFRVADEDWLVLTTAHPNVLLVGPDAQTSEFVEALTSHLNAPVARCRAGVDPLPASRPGGTLVLQDADRLASHEQRQLDLWLSGTQPLQLVTIASTALYPMVEEGSFLATLYYRLNVLYLTFEGPDPGGDARGR